jgi:hypothetical protein
MLLVPFVTVSVPPQVLPEKVAFIFPCVHARSARSTAFFVLKPERYPVNGAVKLWSNLTVPLAPDVNVHLKLAGLVV